MPDLTENPNTVLHFTDESPTRERISKRKKRNKDKALDRTQRLRCHVTAIPFLRIPRPAVSSVAAYQTVPGKKKQQQKETLRRIFQQHIGIVPTVGVARKETPEQRATILTCRRDK